jgi:hypothetical protein
MDINKRTRVLLRIMSDEKTSIFGLPKKHTPKVSKEPTPADARRLIEAQSVRGAITASLIVVIVFGILWAMLSVLIDRIFPWMTVIMGIIIGLAVRRAGHGLDWRFPLIAAVCALLGSLGGNIVVAAAFTAPLLGTDTLTVLSAVTVMTWPVFFDEVMTPADLIFALVSAAVAAFYANRRLTRAEYLALRTWEDADGGKD